MDTDGRTTEEGGQISPVLALIHYHLRCGLYGHAAREASEYLRGGGRGKAGGGISRGGGDVGGDPTLPFWQAVSVGLSGDHSRAIRELNSLRRSSSSSSSSSLLEYPASLALLHFHRLVPAIGRDEDEIEDLEFVASASEEGASVEGVCMSVRFLLCAGDRVRAGKLARTIGDSGSRSFVTYGRPADSDAAEMDALAVRGWAELATVGAGARGADDSTAAIEERLRGSDVFVRLRSEDGARRSLDCLMVLAKYHCLLGETSDSFECLNRAIAISSDEYFPACVYSAKVLLRARRYDEARDAARRAVSLSDGRNAEALRTLALIQALTEGNDVALESALGRAASQLEATEPSNVAVLARTSEAFSRLSRGRGVVLRHTVRLLKLACRSDPSNASYRSELGRQRLLLGDADGAAEEYARAAELDQADRDAMHGTIQCLIRKGELDDAEQQIELLSLVTGQEEGGGGSCDAPEMLFARAMLAERRGGGGEEAARLLREAGERHLEGLDERGGAGVNRDIYEEFVALKPDFLFDVARPLLGSGDCFIPLCPGGDDVAKREWSPDEFVEIGLDLLGRAADGFPAFLEARLLRGKTLLDGGRLPDAAEVLSSCLNDARSSGAMPHLLMARINVVQNDIDSARQGLQEALSGDFSLQNHPLYLLTKGEIALREQSLESAVTTLQEAIALPAVCEGGNDGDDRGSGGGGGSDWSLSVRDRVSCFTTLSSALCQLKRPKEAQRVLKEARSIFKRLRNAPFAEIRLLVQAQLQTDRPDRAIKVLGRVPADSSAYLSARLATADVHLNVRKDGRAYVKIFEELAKSQRTSDSYARLGGAYESVGLLELAISAYERAREMMGAGDDDTSLVLKIGRALVNTHRYREALSYYEAAHRSCPSSCGVLAGFASLCSKLREYDRAAGIVLENNSSHAERVEIRTEEELNDFVAALIDVADYLRDGEMAEEAESVLAVAKDAQKRWMEDSGRNAGADHDDDRGNKALSKLYRLMGECSESRGDFTAAEERYKAAIDTNSEDEESMLCLARLHLNRGREDECAAQAEMVLRADPNCLGALEVMSELMFRRGKYEDALDHQRKLMRQRRSDDDYASLARYVSLLRRCGSLDDAAEAFRLAEKNDPRASSRAGFLYSKGIFYRHSNKFTDAAECFNRVRRSGEKEWQLRALEQMIQLYLNPSNMSFWEAVHDASYAGDSAVSQRTLDSLLDELEVLGDSPEYMQVMRGYCLLASKEDGCIKTALQLFLEVLDVQSDYIPALLGMATAFMIDKSHGKARTYLKKIIKNAAGSSSSRNNDELGDELESSYLMLAETYCERGKLEIVLDLCRRCLLLNKSCSHAWEMMGTVLERQGKYGEAADCFSRSYELDGKTSPSFGYKLALCYYKTKKFVEALSICSEVLEIFPDYHQLRVDVLERCVASLRP